MGCPGQARTKPRRKLAIAAPPRNHRPVAATSATCSARPQASFARQRAWPLEICADSGTYTSHSPVLRRAIMHETAATGWPKQRPTLSHQARHDRAHMCARGKGRGAAMRGGAVAGMLKFCSGIQLAVGLQPLRLRNHNFGLAQRIMVKRLATSRHDPLGITDSACKNQLVVVSVQYGPFNTYIPIRSTIIGKSRVARDPIAIHTSWRSNSDIASVTRDPESALEEEREVSVSSCCEICAPPASLNFWVLLAEPLGSLAFKMAQVRQLERGQKVKLESAAWCWSFSWSFSKVYSTPLVIGSALDHCACTQLRTQSLLLYAVLDLRLSCSALQHSTLELCSSLLLRLIFVLLLLQVGEPA
ncbi:hypothetical protein F511_35655 [Dorcoceras hygrometricum]|uniref:Uncharacterized protein n=1 Tax=Dorcoceras hygrometricum TaxID=472368 RepID=A0A2Z7B2K3_9LAMI|nr:hypothetical protein F511_35655 [Dorcoceras hygrometricum]